MSDKHEERWKAHKYKLGDDGFKVLSVRRTDPARCGVCRIRESF